MNQSAGQARTRRARETIDASTRPFEHRDPGTRGFRARRRRPAHQAHDTRPWWARDLVDHRDLARWMHALPVNPRLFARSADSAASGAHARRATPSTGPRSLRRPSTSPATAGIRRRAPRYRALPRGRPSRASGATPSRPPPGTPPPREPSRWGAMTSRPPGTAAAVRAVDCSIVATPASRRRSTSSRNHRVSAALTRTNASLGRRRVPRRRGTRALARGRPLRGRRHGIFRSRISASASSPPKACAHRRQERTTTAVQAGQAAGYARSRAAGCSTRRRREPRPGRPLAVRGSPR